MKSYLMLCMFAGAVVVVNGCWWVLPPPPPPPPPVDCKWASWSRWSECLGISVNDCTVGQHTRTRIIRTPPLFGGRECEGPFSQTEWCVVADCVNPPPPPPPSNHSHDARFAACPEGYTPAASGAQKAYKMLSQKMKFNQAKQACQDEGSVLAMPRTVEDISDIKEFDLKSHNPWGGMTNNRLKRGVNSQADAEIYLKYLDGTAYTHIPGLILGFNDREGPNPFRIIENNNGELLLADASPSYSYEVLCQYDCQGNIGV